jgi:hypothetical protein
MAVFIKILSMPLIRDMQNLEFNPCCFVMYVMCYQTGF